VRLYDYMDMIRSYMRRQERPGTVGTDFKNHLEHYRAARVVQNVRWLGHLKALHGKTAWSVLQETASRPVALGIDRPALVAVQMGTVTREGNEETHTLPNGRVPEVGVGRQPTAETATRAKELTVWMTRWTSSSIK
jgi:hypothetical protein